MGMPSRSLPRKGYCSSRERRVRFSGVVTGAGVAVQKTRTCATLPTTPEAMRKRTMGSLRSAPGAPAVFGIALIAWSGCHDGKTSPAATEGAATPSEDALPVAETVIRVDDDGKTFDVARGATVTFKLASHGGTGYAWAPTQVDSAALVQQGDRTSELASDIPGAPKLDVFHFTANAAGATTVEMSLRRPFGDAGSVRVVRVAIRVR